MPFSWKKLIKIHSIGPFARSRHRKKADCSKWSFWQQILGQKHETQVRTRLIEITIDGKPDKCQSWGKNRFLFKRWQIFGKQNFPKCHLEREKLGWQVIFGKKRFILFWFGLVPNLSVFTIFLISSFIYWTIHYCFLMVPRFEPTTKAYSSVCLHY